MKKNFFKLVLLVLMLGCISFCMYICAFIIIHKIHTANAEQCLRTGIPKSKYNQCYKDVFTTMLLPKLLVYNYKTKSPDRSYDNLKLRMDNSNRLSSYYAISSADALFGYGIWFDIVFEDNYSLLFDKPAYAFDCAVDFDENFLSSKKCKFTRECIGTDKWVLKNLKSSKRVHLFGNKLRDLKLSDKKVFIKMDIAGAESEVLPEILKYSDNITGMTITFHMDNIDVLRRMISVIDEINKNFVLVSRNTGNKGGMDNITYLNSYAYKGILNNYTYVLSYINKNLLDSYSISMNQNTKDMYKNYKFFYYCSKKKDPTPEWPYCGVVTDFSDSCLKNDVNGKGFCTIPLEHNRISFVIPLLERIKNK